MKIVIIGSGAAAFSAIEELVSKKKATDEISVITNENAYPYYKPSLSKTFDPKNSVANKIKDFYLKPEEYFKKNKVTFYFNHKVKGINFNDKVVLTAKEISNIDHRELDFISGVSFKYDKLLIASGGNSFKVPNIDYANKNVFQLNNLLDFEQLEARLKTQKAKRVLIVGGGILGCESLQAIMRFDRTCAVLELGPTLMCFLLPEIAAQYLQNYIKSIGRVSFYLGRSVHQWQIIGDEILLKFTNGSKSHQYDVIIVNCGVRPNFDFIRSGSLKTNMGIVVNDKLQTSVEDVYAAGDVIELENCKSRKPLLWDPAIEEGKVAANNILSEKATYKLKTDWPVFYSFFDLNLVTYGDLAYAKSHEIKEVKLEIKGKTATAYLALDKKIIKYIAAFNFPGVALLIRRKKANEDLLLSQFEEIVAKYSN